MQASPPAHQFGKRNDQSLTRSRVRDQVSYDFNTLRGDLFGGVTSMVVALPVALAFGVASGLGAAAGLYGAIAVGFFASVFGGTRSQISGPTAPMTVAMAVIVTSHASTLAEALVVVVLAGLLQVLLGVFRAGRFVVYTPYVVVSGFMSGIGIIVIMIHVLPFLGAPTAMGGAMDMIRALPEALGNVNSAPVSASATRQGWSRGNGVCDDPMKPCLSSSGCETRPAKGEPARPVASLAPETVTDSAKRRHASEWAVGR